MSGAVETFDGGERELIRKKLIRYMKENSIGTPKLAERIKASHPRNTEIPLSTLQRFLAGRGKNESCVALCHRFVERVAISDPIVKLGERLSHFYGASDGREYAGVYVGEGALLGTNLATVRIRQKLEIVISADAGFWRVKEKTTSDLYSAVYDGVLVCSGNAALVVLKDRLAGLARSYMLWTEIDLIGCGAESVFKAGDRPKEDAEPISIRLAMRDQSLFAE